MARLLRVTEVARSLWPGLPAVWSRGSWLGLVVSLLFASLVQASIFAWIIWPELIGPITSVVVCFVTFAFWLLHAGPQIVQVFAKSDPAPVQAEHLFRGAQDEYLKGNWFQAEQLFAAFAERDPTDLESRMMLAGLYRRLNRFAEAREQLQLMLDCTRSASWEFEINREHELITACQRGGEARPMPKVVTEAA